MNALPIFPKIIQIGFPKRVSSFSIVFIIDDDIFMLMTIANYGIDADVLLSQNIDKTKKIYRMASASFSFLLYFSYQHP
jgi:hypothetical protein